MPIGKIKKTKDPTRKRGKFLGAHGAIIKVLLQSMKSKVGTPSYQKFNRYLKNEKWEFEIVEFCCKSGAQRPMKKLQLFY